MYMGENFLLPLSFDVSWSRPGPEVFNARPVKCPTGYQLDKTGLFCVPITQADTDAANAAAAGALPISVPFGQSDRPWINPCQTHTVAITQGTDPTIAILGGNPRRNLLVIQNNSTADGTLTPPDVAPTFYVGLGHIAQVGYDLALPPGVGIVLDIICPNDGIYITIGPEVDTGDTVNIAGCVIEGTYVS